MKSIKELLNYFEVKRAGDITWSHAVNSREKLSEALLNQKIMIIESDIVMSDKDEIITAHPPLKTSNLCFEDLIKEVSGKKKGLKLDFKEEKVLDYSLDYLKNHPLKEPVILNADILSGNKAGEPKINSYFIEKCLNLYPQAFLSLGWITSAGSPYTKENAGEMMDLCQNIDQDILLPLRASLLPGSWENLKEILNIEKYWPCLWENNELIDGFLLNWIKRNTNPEKTFYDLIFG